ncbi:MAG: hypothetical protein WAM24_14600, partial [Ignavibacteriaceae bacterium]
MTNKNFVILLLLLLLPGFTFAQLKYSQPTDSADSYYYRNLTPQQAEKIFGPIKGKKFNKVSGDSREIKDIT